MNEMEKKNSEDCMKKIHEVLQEFGCELEIVYSFSSKFGPSFMLKTIPTKKLVLANAIPKMGDN